MKTLTTILAAALVAACTALLLAGCSSTMTDMKPSESHPANPNAAQAAYPPPIPFLIADTNVVVTKPLPATPPEHEHGHQHGTKPKPKDNDQ